MIIVTNRMKTKQGFAEKLAPKFTKPGPLQEMEGFHKVEVTITENPKDYDELNVNMYWHNYEGFQAWKNSDMFKEAHKGTNTKEAKQDSPVIDSEIIVSKVASIITSTKN
ncbi:heme oxygenase [Oceanobacillus salinisoli]|uniref:heme oxygenase n=1 Tax=Oceanobacillus salinisoli TaxID=2678611 RepID=UPI0012E21D22|nr:heme oxygenase [Oceanobacillus salinisoli]